MYLLRKWIGISTWQSQGELDFLRELIIEYLNDVSGELNNNTPVFVSYSKENTVGIHRLLSDAGFEDISIQVENFPIKYNSSDEWYDLMLRVGWILKRFVGKDDVKLQDFKEKYLPHRLADYKKADEYYFTKSVIFAFATK